MPGIFVKQRDEDLIQVKAPYFDDYIKRLRKIDGARWGGDDDPHWILPIESLEDLDDAFYDELIYENIDREDVLGLDPPPISPVFKQVKRYKVRDLKKPLRPFQKFGVNFLAHVLTTKGVGLLGDLMGTGKTLQSMCAALQLKQQGKVNKVLVVVLASTRKQWEKEIAKFTYEQSVVFGEFRAKYKQKDGKRFVAESIDDQKKAMIDSFKQDSTMFMIVSYQGLQQNADFLEKAGFDMLIMDEAHYAKNRMSKTNKAAKKLVAKRTKRSKYGEYAGIPYTLFVSGTPIMNYPDEIYGLTSIAGEHIFGKWRDFRKEYCVLNEYNDVIGYRNLSKLNEINQSFLIRRTDKEIGVDLPQMIEDDIVLDPHPQQVKLDRDLRTEMKDLLSKRNVKAAKAGDENAILIEQRIKGIKNMRIAGGCHPNTFLLADKPSVKKKFAKYAVKNELDIPKFQRCLELTEEAVISGRKVVIFVNSRRMTVLLHRAIKKFTNAVRYIGGLTDEVRERRREKFNHHPNCMVIIANSAGSTGLNLQSGRVLINYDLPHTPAEWQQRKYRIRRLDSTHDKVYIINLINRGLVDEEMREKLDEKQASFDGTIENNKATTAFHQQMNVKNEKRRKPKQEVIFDFT